MLFRPAFHRLWFAQGGLHRCLPVAVYFQTLWLMVVFRTFAFLGFLFLHGLDFNPCRMIVKSQPLRQVFFLFGILVFLLVLHFLENDV